MANTDPREQMLLAELRDLRQRIARLETKEYGANVGAAIAGASTDDTIDNADLFGRTTSGTLVKTTWSNIKATLNALYVTLTGNQTIAGEKTFSDPLRAGSTFQVDGLTLFTLGARSFLQAINDDNVASFTVNTHGWLILNGNNNAGDYAIVQFRAAATLYMNAIALGANVNATTGVLTGTTGTDGKITVSVSGNTVYIENRKGSTRTIAGLLLAT